VWFQDEARIGQQGTLTTVWAETGSRPTAVKQTEYEWVYLFAAVNPQTGASSALIAPTVNTEMMNHHLRFIAEAAGADTHVVLVLDQAGWHMAKALEAPKNITLLHFGELQTRENGGDPVARLQNRTCRRVGGNSRSRLPAARSSFRRSQPKAFGRSLRLSARGLGSC